MSRLLPIAAVTAVAVTGAPALAQTGSSDFTGSTAQKLDFQLRTTSSLSNVTRIRFDFRARTCHIAQKGAQGSIRATRRLRVRSRSFTGRGRETARIPAGSAFAGGRQVERWSVRGRFTADGKRVSGTFAITVEIRNPAGALVDTCRTTKRVRWSARRVGVEYELPSAR